MKPAALRQLTILSAALLAAGAVSAQEAAIRKNLAEHVPTMPKIDEVRPSPIPGIYEVRYGGTEIVYTDAKGEYIFQGALVEAKTMTNLTEARIDKLTAIDFSALPVKDAITYKQGTGARKLAVFVDPNCGYCKRFERDLVGLKDVTIYTFIMPILGPDSNVKARDIWCSKDNAKTWRSWMIEGVAPQRTMGGGCDSAALDRNVEFGRKYRVQGTPGVFFEDGTRKPGAIPAAELEKLLVAATAAGPKKN